jgi:NAD-dependent SIR2 family protein deacetylase
MIELARLVELARGRRVVALTGAGISTESGIPDYRGPKSRGRARTPMQHAEFVGSAEARQLYWARSFRGWPTIAAARPNRGHRALAALERAGLLGGIITQNVDGLHAAAGSRRVIELHGALADVICLDCGGRERRAALQRRLAELNPALAGSGAGPLRPDGDVEIGGDVRRFAVAPCAGCGGPLKPDVVFFGGSIPRPWTEAAWALYAEAELLLVIGSSPVPRRRCRDALSTANPPTGKAPRRREGWVPFKERQRRQAVEGQAQRVRTPASRYSGLLRLSLRPPRRRRQRAGGDPQHRRDPRRPPERRTR